MTFPRAFSKITILLFLLTSSFHALAQQISGPVNSNTEKYTYLTEPALIRFRENPSRLALLIGNSNYDLAPRDTSQPHRLPMVKVSGCEDVRMIARKLADIGWDKRDIVVLCDQNRQNIEAAVAKFAGKAPLGGSDSRLMLVYLAGHGMYVDQRNYFFGTNALPDFDHMAEVVAENRLSGASRVLFDEDAVDILKIFTERVGVVNYPLLVIVDTCRNNPLSGKIRRMVQQSLNRRTPAERERLESYLTLGTTRYATDIPWGMSVVFATTPSNTIPDTGDGQYSRLAEAFAEKIAPNRSIRLVLQDVYKKLNYDNSFLPDPALAQKLSQDSQLWSDDEHGEWCFHGCARPGISFSPSKLPKLESDLLHRPLFSDPYKFWTASFAQSGRKPIRAGSTTPAPAVIFQDSDRPGDHAALVVDVFWCEGDSKGNARYAAARSASLAIKEALLTVVEQPNSKPAVSTVRLRPLSKSTNSRAGYQRNEDGIFFDKGDRIEIAFAAFVRANASQKLNEVMVKRSSPGYVSIFFCKDAFTSPRAPLLFVQVPTTDELGTASSVIAFLDDNFANVNVQRKAEVVSGPIDSELRYFSGDQTQLATDIADALSKLTGVDVKPVNQCPNPKSCRWQDVRNLEFWLGTDDLGKANAPPPFQQTVMPFEKSV